MVKITKKENKAWVTFTYGAQDEVKSVDLMGSWNDWTPEAMKQKKDGSFSATKILPLSATFEFGYKINGNSWCKEDTVACTASPFGGENALLNL